MNKPIGYQLVDADGKYYDQMHSFEIYPLNILLPLFEQNKKRWRLLPIYEGDIEKPTLMLNIGVAAPKLLKEFKVHGTAKESVGYVGYVYARNRDEAERMAKNNNINWQEENNCLETESFEIDSIEEV